jgi:hypothetical protein
VSPRASRELLDVGVGVAQAAPDALQSHGIDLRLAVG